MQRNRSQLRAPSAPPASPRRMVADMPNIRRAEPPASPAARYPEGRRLVVGRDITLAGQISKCDFLIVEGSVDGMRYEGQSLEVSESGAFSGNVEVDHAEISGNFEGTMAVRGRLTIRPTGRVSGNIRYSEIEVLAGGRLSGEVALLEQNTPRNAAPVPQHAPGTPAAIAANAFAALESAGGDEDDFIVSERMVGE
ncbi:MAG TPA: polymer-forming cytoskeletal protein [Alphaproteobacteria bacterium]|nr:polymer-forming cytoskeletal protein [Alphaproteobacteria bacterium]